MKLRRIDLTPGFLSISFGIFLIALTGAAGFYMPTQTRERSSIAAPGTAAGATRSSPPVSAATLTAVTSGTGQSNVSSPGGPSAPTPAMSPTVAPAVRASATATATVTAPTVTPTPTVHIVKAGDTLSEIAEKYGVTTDALQRANGLRDPDKLAVGDKLVIPGR